ncbi:RNA polymerase II C-terminal domain phosphatase-like 3 [Populus alba x Populus x berolinensis]|nr:RNA polymerase II C-terminal domain phosphatase-like 3 [Populus alba x Populus x berolinensis]
MGKNEIAAGGGSSGIEDVEEGEISDTASVEEISEEDFNKQEVVIVKETPSSNNSTQKVWTVRDLYKYQVGGGYMSGLYNFAWARAVQNKPLNELFVEVELDDSSKKSSINSSKEDKRTVVIDDSGDEMDVVKVIDIEKEKGELEEGEIDLDSEPVVVQSEGMASVDVENKVKSIRKDLESVSVIETEKSFEAVCLKLHKVLESLKELVGGNDNNFPSKDGLVQLLFMAIGVVNSVFCSMNQKLKEQNKGIFSRFFSLLNSHCPPFFSPGQNKEIELMVSSMGSYYILSSSRTGEDRETQVSGEVNENHNDSLAKTAGYDLTTMNEKLPAAETFVQNKPNKSIEAPKPPGVPSFKSRGVLLPLLDLKKYHDEDSLPSPTQETTPFPVQRLLAIGDGMVNSGLPVPKVAPVAEEPRMHPYETDALKAVSSYQQKFNRNSFFTNELPSPTPSEESGNGDGDTAGEVSSSLTVVNYRTVNPPVSDQKNASPSPPPPPPRPHPDSSNIRGVVPTRNSAPVSSGPSSTIKASAKSRDPRLRYVNIDASALDHNQRALPMVNNLPRVEPAGAIVGLKKQKIDEDVLDGPSLKRQRNSFDNYGAIRDIESMTGTGGWLEDTDMAEPQTVNKNQCAENVEPGQRINNGFVCPSSGSVKSNVNGSGNVQSPFMGISNITGSEQAQVTSTATTSLPDLLKDIAVNPTMLINILKMGQQQGLALDGQQALSDPAKSTSHPPISNSVLGAIPTVNVASSQPSGILPRPAGTQVPSQIATSDESGKIRMKPRDPRRFLHNHSLQRAGSLGSEQFKTTTLTPTTQGTKDDQNVQKQEGLAELKPTVPPDISFPFTKSLENIADILSVSQASTTAPFISQNVASQPMQTKSERVDGKTGISISDKKTGPASSPEVVAASSHSQNTWKDVEHLFEGYDDKQKAAIQRERARRLEEQKKMFAARKLCLVLDLDHTLLNSAKFVEVDPVHDEILRKKEEQDREKPYRHIFRIPHMGMWTKLRPGIWNFLEKASKLFELHLYTMGNKLYATEMAKVLDPKGVLFAGRVISRGDDGDPFDGDERVPKSKDLEGVLGMESGVVIIDDSVRVWPHNKLNLIVVERYIYFPCSRRQFGLPGPSLLEIDHDERPEDGTLACSLAVIEKIHQNFFTHHSLDEADVRNILASEQRKILGGCRILFSRVFPVGEVNPHLHPLWQMAEQFGAVCTNQIDEQVTHVVANSLGTDKVNWALSTGRIVVHPGWVEASALLYRRANEQDFAIKP